MLERTAWKALDAWSADQKAGRAKKALMITGARQIGKTTLVRAFARERYAHFAELNFLEDPEAARIFGGSLDADTIITNLTAYLRTPLEAGSTLILLDEIQECPPARTAIKFLVEDGRFDYVETGSLLGVRTRQVASYPVGFEQQLHMYPLDFEEFCRANGVQQRTLDTLRQHFTERTPVPDAVHATMMQLWQAYLIVGGMPDAVQEYVTTHDIARVTQIHRDLLALYRLDIAKYAEKNDETKIRAIFDAIPSQLDDKNRRFVLADLSKSARQNRYASSFLWLADAGVALPCYNVKDPVRPLEGSGNHSLFKLFLNDTGLLCTALMGQLGHGTLQYDILQGRVDANLGAVMENVIAQELRAHGFELYYLNAKSYGEVDFMVESGLDVLPIEVKSGRDWTRHKALDNVMAVSEWHIPVSYVLCRGNVTSSESDAGEHVIYLPLYMSMFIEPQRAQGPLIHTVDVSAL